MGQAYLETLKDIAGQKNGNGQISQDIDYWKARDFHDDVLTKNGQSLDNWTLKTPMDLLEKTYGKDAVN
jgi:hypothetical protein